MLVSIFSYYLWEFLCFQLNIVTELITFYGLNSSVTFRVSFNLLVKIRDMGRLWITS